jgi:acetolactate decarboxylase
MKNRLTNIIVFAFILFFFSAANAQDKNNIFQYSVISALMQGNYDGNLSIGQLKEKGDFGLGTLNTLDGEVVILDGEFFQVTSEGKVNRVPSEALTPFAVVTHFKADIKKTVPLPQTLKVLTSVIDKSIGSLNQIYAFKISGTFSYVKTRSVPAQQKPYKKLVDVTKTQAVFEFKDIKGTVLGFRFPSYVDGVNVPGYHLHFISDDRTAGGHVLDFTTSHVTCEYAVQKNITIAVPGEGDFLDTDLSKNNPDEVNKAEK